MKDNLPVYWTMRNGKKISVDDMDINHLRNTLKMIIKSKRAQSIPVFKVHGEIASEFADMAMLHSINPELTCNCDEFHTCQQCIEEQ
jgi:hypothetical protein